MAGAQGGTLTYNGITIYVVKTNSIISEPIYTPDNSAYLYTKYTVNISGIINPQETSYANSPPVFAPGQIPANTYNRIRHFLGMPQMKLQFSNFGTPIFNVPGDGYLTDAADGPTPGQFVITRIDGGRTFHINYSIVFYLIECPLGTRSALIANRFGQSHTIDENHFTSIVTRGTAYFRKDGLLQENKVADMFRDQLLPFVPPGFKRVSANFSVNTKGSTIEYEVVDREQVINLGDTGVTGSATFITKIDGYFNQSTISGPADNGFSIPLGMSMATMNIKLWGNKYAATWTLTQVAFQLMASSGMMPIGRPEVGIVHQFTITQGLSERYVEVTLAMRIAADKNGKFGEIRTEFLAKPDEQRFPTFNGINPDFPNDSGTRGTSTVTLLSSELTEACAQPPSSMAAFGTGGMGPPQYAGPPPAVSVQPTERIPPSLNRYSEQQTTYPYPQYEIDSYYETNKGIYQAPVSGSKDTTSSSGEPTETSSATDLPTCSIVNLHLPVSRRRVKWKAERFFKIPQVPAWESNNPAQVLMDYKINTAEVIVMPDGQTPCYRVTGEYLYAMKRDLSTFESIAFDIPPLVDYPYGQQALTLPPPDTYEGGDFSQGIINGRYNT